MKLRTSAFATEELVNDRPRVRVIAIFDVFVLIRAAAHRRTMGKRARERAETRRDMTA